MADFNAISDVTATLQAVLADDLVAVGAVCQIDDLSTPIAVPPPAPLLTLTLYEAIEDPSARNRPNERVVDPATGRIVTRRPPACLLLRYLVTPWSGAPLSDHLILGRAIQSLYDHAIIAGAELVGSLRPDNEAIHVTMVPLSLEDRTHVWRAIGGHYRLSANYEVRVVHIDGRDISDAPAVRSRRLRVARPEGPS
ncbi:MAG: DUF4255 domain-containing protein [Kofleriaceae bacterium]|nr:DUF4255 domain-containing protein [Myxococcales bacterium]MCB9563793.1 DUF4255 domain-containing protein [Kofleriaceae bacterium]MCB9572643.1 DUF4255 domain-containing protein [Kofleriaceae bacterium]